jgi:hypothetical protein
MKVQNPNLKEIIKKNIINNNYDNVVRALDDNLKDNKNYIESIFIYSIVSENIELFIKLLKFIDVFKNSISNIIDPLLKKNNLTLVKELLKKVPHDVIDAAHPLTIASHLNNKGAVELFLNEGFSAKTDDYFSLRIAVEHNNLAITKILIKSLKDIKDIGEELLFYAINNNNSAMCRLILRNYQLNESNYNSLYYALDQNKDNLTIPYILLNHNARLSSPLQLKSLLTGFNISPITFLMKYPEHPDREMVLKLIQN